MAPPSAPLARPRDVTPIVRDARLDDLDALVGLEARCFATDRLSRRRLRYMIARAHARLVVADAGAGALAGYALVLFRKGTSLARLYSIAVDPPWRGRGLGSALLAAAEDAARDDGFAYLRLEVRRDNAATYRLYRRAGYRPIDVVADYYEDGMEAQRLEKALAPALAPDIARVPYYEQTLDFTCGPAALMMAMRALDPHARATRTLELRLWREATTVFMTSGHGGCGPLGLALAARHRGFGVEVFLNDEGVPFLDTVRSPLKKEVMTLVHEEMREEIEEAGIPVVYGTLGLDALRERFDAGAVPIVLTSSYRRYGEKNPHWVVVAGFEDRFVYVNDPFVDREEGETETDSIALPIEREEFARMARYGRAGLQAIVLVYRDPAEVPDP